MRPSSEILILPCPLNDDEIRLLGMQLASERPKEEQMDCQMKEFSDQVKANKAKIHARVVDLSSRINLKKEFREVQCAIRYDFAHNEKIWIRRDLNEIVKKEEIPKTELQEEEELGMQPEDTQPERA